MVDVILLVSAVQRGVVSGEHLPAPVVVVVHHVEPVVALGDGGQVVANVESLVVSRHGGSEKFAGSMQGGPKLLGEKTEVLPVVLRVGSLPVPGVFPVKVDPVPAKDPHKFHHAVDENLSSFGLCCHPGPLLGARVPTSDGEESFQFGVFLLQFVEPPVAVVMAVVAIAASIARS